MSHLSLLPRYLVRTLLLVITLCATSKFSSSTATESVKILFGGDTSHAESYQVDYAANGGENILTERGYDYPLAQFGKLMNRCDLVILNLETPLTNIRQSPLQGKDYYHWSDPVQATASLKRNNVTAVSLANNHTLDYGKEALQETLDALEQHDITAFGAGKDLEAAAKPYQIELQVGEQDFSLAVIGCFEWRDSYQEYDFYASADSPGANSLSLEKLSQQISELRSQHADTFVVVFPHWGKNYEWTSKKQQKLGRQMIDAGADLVLGHGAHCMQEIERYRDRWIVYSIGNFMFNSRGRYQLLSAQPFSLPAVMHCSETKGELTKNLRFYPIISDNTLTEYQPRWVTKEEFDQAFNALCTHSQNADLRTAATSGEDHVGLYFEIPIN